MEAVAFGVYRDSSGIWEGSGYSFVCDSGGTACTVNVADSLNDISDTVELYPVSASIISSPYSKFKLNVTP